MTAMLHREVRAENLRPSEDLRTENMRLSMELAQAEGCLRRCILKAEQERADLGQEVVNLRSLIAQMLATQPSLRPLAVAAGFEPATADAAAVGGTAQSVDDAESLVAGVAKPASCPYTPPQRTERAGMHASLGSFGKMAGSSACQVSEALDSMVPELAGPGASELDDGTAAGAEGEVAALTSPLSPPPRSSPSAAAAAGQLAVSELMDVAPVLGDAAGEEICCKVDSVALEAAATPPEQQAGTLGISTPKALLVAFPAPPPHVAAEPVAQVPSQSPAPEPGKPAPWAPHLTSTAEAVEYQLVVPTYKRWRSTSELRKRTSCADPSKPFILTHTLAFLLQQGVPRSRVTLFVADDTEAQSYRHSLRDSEWSEMAIIVSAPGIRDSRNFICRYYAEGTYVVSVDDDVEGIAWKHRQDVGNNELKRLPAGSLEKLIFDAHCRMRELGAHLWGLSTSRNPRFMDCSTVSVRNGLVNGYLHGFICRPQCTELIRTLVDAVEDAEFSVRHYAKDGVVLRYRMYAGITCPYQNGGGLQAKFEHTGVKHTTEARGAARKMEERQGALDLNRLFPQFIGPPRVHGAVSTMEVHFRPLVRTLSTRVRRVRRSRRDKRKPLPALGALGQRKLGKMALNTGRRKRRLLRGVTEADCEASYGAKRIRSKVVSPDLRDNDRIQYKPNPKRPGSRAHELYECYQSAQTVADARKLGARPIDFAHDWTMGHLIVTCLSTEPTSTEFELRDPGAGRIGEAYSPSALEGDLGDTIMIRVLGMGVGHPGLALQRDALMRLSGCCPVLRDVAPGHWLEEGGPLATVQMDVLRVLLHWGDTGVLRFGRRNVHALSTALEGLGAEAAARMIGELPLDARGPAPGGQASGIRDCLTPRPRESGRQDTRSAAKECARDIHTGAVLARQTSLLSFWECPKEANTVAAHAKQSSLMSFGIRRAADPTVSDLRP